MSSDDKHNKTPESGVKHEPAKPEAERKPGETAKPDNKVRAKDPFGAPRPDPNWTPEAIQTVTRQPSYGGAEDKVRKEQSKQKKD